MIVSGQTFNTHQQLIEEVKKTDQTRGYRFSESSEDHQVTLLFRPVTSRAESDVEAAMTEITGETGITLLFVLGSCLKLNSLPSFFWHLQMINLLFWSSCTTALSPHLRGGWRMIQKLYCKSTFFSTTPNLDCSHVKKTASPSPLYERNYWSTARGRFQNEVWSLKMRAEKRLKVQINNRSFMMTDKRQNKVQSNSRENGDCFSF